MCNRKQRPLEHLRVLLLGCASVGMNDPKQGVGSYKPLSSPHWHQPGAGHLQRILRSREEHGDAGGDQMDPFSRRTKEKLLSREADVGECRRGDGQLWANSEPGCLREMPFHTSVSAGKMSLSQGEKEETCFDSVNFNTKEEKSQAQSSSTPSVKACKALLGPCPRALLAILHLEQGAACGNGRTHTSRQKMTRKKRKTMAHSNVRVLSSRHVTDQQKI